MEKTRFSGWYGRFGAGLAFLVLVFAGWFLWASASLRPTLAPAEVKRYAAAPAAARDTLTVMTYNIGYLSGMTNNRPVARTQDSFSSNLEAAVRIIDRARPDIIGFQEIDFGAARSFGVHQLDTLAMRGGYAAAAQAVNWDKRYVPFPSANPFMQFGRMASGQAVLSRYPIRTHERVVLERPATLFVYDAFYLDRLAQVVEVEAGQPMVLINVHLEAFDRATRERQAAVVRDLYRQYRADYPVLLLGDFNSRLPADPSDDRTLATLLEIDGLAEAFPDSLYRTQDTAAYGTYPSPEPSRKIDHIFYDARRFEVVEAYIVTGPDQPSDHRAVVARFVMR
jgi:endonuclease/exonuclease/phosphatase family metal-dependent hydrolase